MCKISDKIVKSLLSFVLGPLFIRTKCTTATSHYCCSLVLCSSSSSSSSSTCCCCSCSCCCCCSDGSYVDPLGPQMERPRTAARRRGAEQSSALSDEFNNEQIGDDLLPD